MPLSDYRAREFGPVTSGGVYVNHAGVSPSPARVVRAVTEGAALAARDPFGFFMEGVLPARERARARFAEMLGVSADHCCFTKNTGHGLSLLADGLHLEPADNVVSASCEYPAVVYPWYAQADRGIETRLIDPRPDGTLSLDDCAAKMDARTRVVTLSWVQFGTGFRADLSAWASLAHTHGAIFVVDVIQGLGALPLDLGAAGVDAAASGVHKWLLAPGGTGVLFVTPAVLERLRLVNMGAGAVVDVGKFDPLDFSVKPNPQRFEEGTPNGLGLLGLDAALGLLTEVGVEAIGARVLELCTLGATLLERKGYEVASPMGEGQQSGLLCFRHAQHSNEAVLEALGKAGVTAAARGGNVRFSPHFYNHEEDMARAVDALPA